MIGRLVMAVVLAAPAAPVSAASGQADRLGGLYEIIARIELPNVAPVADPVTATRCLTGSDLTTGAAFGVLSRNPLGACARSGVNVSGAAATFRITCPGPNAPWANARFELTPTGFKGVIHMNMGGKNMTMTERQSARRLGDCP